MRFAIAGLVVMALLIAGCGGKVTKTPEGTARAYVNFMKASQWKDAALLWDYEEQARRDNENWDDIPQGQRKEIIGKLADEKAQSLQMWSTHMTPDLKVETVETTGDNAHALLNGAISGLDLIKVGDQWLISGMN